MNANALKYLPFLTLLILFSCGKDGGPTGTASFTESSIIVGDLDWKDVTTLSSSSGERENSFAVGSIDLPVMRSRCTGFLISDDVLMTNHHCIPSSGFARGVTVTFNHESGVVKNNFDSYDCSEFIGNNEELDFALLRCVGSPGSKYGFMTLDSTTVSLGEEIYVVQQNCDYYNDRNCEYSKKISYGTVLKSDASVTHDADTLGGSSGSPIFNKSGHTVSAIHHAGLGNNGQGRGVENYGVPMKNIVPFILQNFPSVTLSLANGSSTSPSTPSIPTGNDTFLSADKLGRFKSLNGSISSSGDVDYFSFEVNSASAFVEIELSIKDSGKDLDLYVFNSQENLLGKSEGVTSFEAFSQRLSVGKYYVLVKGYKGAKANYNLLIK